MSRNVARTFAAALKNIHPAAREVAVFARPHARPGEGAMAAFVLAEGRSLTYQQLLDHPRAGRARFKFPKDMMLLPNFRAVHRARCSSAPCAGLTHRVS